MVEEGRKKKRRKKNDVNDLTIWISVSSQKHRFLNLALVLA